MNIINKIFRKESGFLAAILVAIVFLLGIISVSIADMTGTQEKKLMSKKPAFTGNVVKETEANKNFRKVIFTGMRDQLVVMDIKPGEDIGMESHSYVEQTIFILSGQGKSVLNGVEKPLVAGDVVITTPGTNHDIVNTGKESLKIYTIYVPPNHIDGTVHKTKQDAQLDKKDQEFGSKVR